MDEAQSCDNIAFIFNSKLIALGTPTELIEREQVSNLEDVFIRYVEKSTNQKIQSSFEDLKFLTGEEMS
jgi:ABC-2 type transport system ATP-binding protein